MDFDRVLRRFGRWVDAVRWRLAGLRDGEFGLRGFASKQRLHTAVTFRAVVDAVIPETPALGDELGPEHVPGGLAVALDDFVRGYVDAGFQLGFPYLGPQGNIPMAAPIARVLDIAAGRLLDRGENVAAPRDDRPLTLLEPGEASPGQVARAAGPFAKLSRRDRLRALGLLDEFELSISPTADDLFEFDAGLVGQLVVGFTELIYYSEWEGYDDFERPPSERTHPNDPAAVQSWRQTGYPGVADGYAALRGYLGSDERSLGDGAVWTTVDADADDPVTLSFEPGTFRENDYDTSGYEEPFPE
jgi:hypothetical protein